MKILHVQLLPIISGVQKVSLDIFDKLANETDYKLYSITKEPGPYTKRLKELGVECFYVDSFTRNIHLIKNINSLIRLCKIIAKISPDIIHTHSSITGVLGRFAAFLCGIKVVIHSVHGFSFPSAKNFITRWFYKSIEYAFQFFTSHYFVLNTNDQRILIEEFGVSASKVERVSNSAGPNYIEYFFKFNNSFTSYYKRWLFDIY